jgi:WD40 repeat protein
MQLSIEDGVTTVAISPDGRFVAAGSLDRSVRVWDSATGYLVQRLEGPDGHRDSVYSVAFSPTGRELVSGSLDKTIKMWELAPQRSILPSATPNGGKCIRTFEGHKVSAPPILFGTSFDTNITPGLRSQRMLDARRRVGHERLEGSWRAVLGPQHRTCPDDASGTQELGHLSRP